MSEESSMESDNYVIRRQRNRVRPSHSYQERLDDSVCNRIRDLNINSSMSSSAPSFAQTTPGEACGEYYRHLPGESLEKLLERFLKILLNHSVSTNIYLYNKY